MYDDGLLRRCYYCHANKRIGFEVWVRLESSRHSFLGKKMFDRQGSYQLLSIEINVLRQHWSCTVQCTSLEKPFDRLVIAIDYCKLYEAIIHPFCLKKATGHT